MSNSVLGNVSVGNTWALPPALTVQYHFLHKNAFSPYVGGGVNYTMFYNSKPNNSIIEQVKLEDNWGGVIEAGFDYNVTGHWFLNANVKQIFVHTTAKLATVLGPVKAKTDLNPTVAGFGIGYRF